ncbi:zinc-dependent alcohol dehydrogenase [Rhodopirellula halodulae]|uniref:zinc-dependent alcohol dehydrogenase n=1 Tax=Rhodopirellula halodulae TaxID=2894198 RepID=UPI001E3C9705|nr:zinc-dependent alcohol dehydrogenase [Rhodopirellula sp. JC737]MCC9654220.1 glutathione-dependent formaldehyde dehydrogenase [Rhodopirellula sp. JC737]
MKAVCWHGRNDIRVDNVDDPKILDPRDAIIKITASGICGSDLHLMAGAAPAMEAGDIIGHEPMGEVVEVGSAVTNLKNGDRVVVPFTISCGACYFCQNSLYSLCDESNRNAEQAQKIMGHSPAGLFGYTHMLGGYAGGQAEYLRVPYANVGPIVVPDGIPDEQVVFLSDIFPTGYMAAENCDIQPTDTVAVWGCGPVGQFAIQSAWMLGAKRVIAIDCVAERLEMARSISKAEVIDYEKVDVYETLQEMTKGRGPDCCIDAVGAENHAAGQLQSVLDDAKTAMHLGSDRPHVLNEIFKCCRKAGKVSVPGVYFSSVNLQWGTAMNKGLQIRLGQTHMQRYLTPLMEKITGGEIDPSFVITHVEPLDNAPDAYRKFRDKEDGCIKVVLKP